LADLGRCAGGAASEASQSPQSDIRHSQLHSQGAWRWVVIAFTACLVVGSVGSDLGGTPKRPMVLVHYMPWFVAKPAVPMWGWHWTMNAFDPEKFEGGKRSIAAHYVPLIGPYNSGDAAVIEYHCLLMKLAGIDGIIVDWYGLSNLHDYAILHQNTSALFPAATRLGLKVGICYEDQTIPRLVESGQIAKSDRVKHAREVLGWLRTNWFAEPSYLTLSGRPVLLSFGFDGLTDREWEQALPKEADAPVYLSEHRQRPNAAGAYDWPVPKEWLASLDRFSQAAKDWPVKMPVAFPRFHDIYAEAKVHESYGRIPDDQGRTFVMTLQRALTSGAPLVQVVTWNDWGEGTAIEPSAEFGYRDLETIQRLRRELVDPAFAPAWEDLRLAHRLYLLRLRQATRLGLEQKLDEVARLLAIGQLPSARAQLIELETESK
jgi:hypothetical protein